MAERSRRQELMDEAYADAMLKLRENHEEEFDRILKQEQEQRGLKPSKKGGSETEDGQRTDPKPGSALDDLADVIG